MKRLQQILTGIAATSSGYTPEGCEGYERPIDNYILVTVRLDLQLVELCNSVHAFLGRTELAPDFEAELVAVRSESEERARKCLKLAV